MNDPIATSGPRATRPSPPAGGVEAPPRDTRAALLAAGRDLFAGRGYDGASVRAITRRAGANLGAITYHFGSKRALYGAVLEAEMAPLREAVLGAAAGEGTALERISAIVEVYFRHLGDHPVLPRLLLQEISAGRRPPEPVVQIVRTVAGTLAGLAEEGARDGSVRPGDPLLTALSVVAQPIYLTLVTPMIREVTGMALDHADHRAAVVAHATEFVRAGLTPRQETDR